MRIATEMMRMTVMPAMRPSLASTAIRTQEQEEVKSNMYPVGQGVMVWRGQWHWQLSGSQVFSDAMQADLASVLLQ